MNAPIRLYCGECLRSVEREFGDSVGSEVCDHCGGGLRTAPQPRFVSTVEQRTPLSLELSPDFTSPWSEDSADGPAPERLGRYQLRERLGGGGFGQVYRAFDPRLERDIALKILKEGRPSARVMERFFREARAAGQLDHPNIVALHDAGRDAGRCWIAYQYISGPSLSQLAEAGPVGPRRAAQIVRELADAVHHAHRRGVFHRDIKPANVIIDEGGRPRLTDFGLARRVDLDPTLTREGTILGTPAYMSPEQAAGNSHQADARSDVYSLGVILHELLSGRRPAELASTRISVHPLVRRATPPPKSATPMPRIPRALRRIYARALAEEPAERYPDASRLADDLERYLSNGRRKLHGLLATIFVIPLAFTTWQLARRPPETAAIRILTPPESARPLQSPGNKTEVAVPAKPDPFVGNRETRIVHPAGCRHLVSLRRDHAVAFSNGAEARAKGYRPCGLATQDAH